MTGFWHNFWDSIFQPHGKDFQLLPSILLTSLMAVALLWSRVEWPRARKTVGAVLVIAGIFALFAGANYLDALLLSDLPGHEP